MKSFFAILALGATLAAHGDGSSAVTGGRLVEAFPEIREMPAEKAAEGAIVRLKGFVTFVRSDGFVLAPTPERDQNAVFVLRTSATQGPAGIHEGDEFRVEGRTCVWGNIAAVEASSLVRLGKKALPAPKLPKWYDARMGWRNLRRGRLEGIVTAADEVRRGEEREITTVLTLLNGNDLASVHISGRIPAELVAPGNRIEAIGIVRNFFDSQGKPMAWIFEVASPDGVHLVSPGRDKLLHALLAALWILALIAAIGFCIAWLRGRRERREMKIVAADRKRIARDLHDTIAQHLAGARILLDGAFAVDGVPQSALKRINTAREVIVNAANELREVVGGLYADITDAGSFETALAALAAQASLLSGAKIEIDCQAMRSASVPCRAEMYTCALMIVRESIANAVKHGKARNIRIFADALTMKVSNDGAPFNPDSAPGPEAGHYGLSSMRERCARHDCDITFGCEDGWSFVEVRRRNLK